MIKFSFLIFTWFICSLAFGQVSEYKAYRYKLNGTSDSYLYSENAFGRYHLIGTYPGWDKEGIYIAGYNSTNTGSLKTRRIYVGKSIIFDLKENSFVLGAKENQGIRIGRFRDQLGWDGSGKQPGYHIRFAGYRDVAGNITGARISALRTNVCCSGKHQGMELAFYVAKTMGTYSEGDVNLEEAMRLKANGNVGIGTSSPDLKLDVISSDFRAFRLKRDPSIGAGGVALSLENSVGDGIWTIGAGSNQEFGIFREGDTFGKKFFIDEKGKVGIGTIKPKYKLSVNGRINCSGILFDTGYLPDEDFFHGGNYLSFGHPGHSEDFIGYRNNTFFFKDSPGGGDTKDPNIWVGGNITSAKTIFASEIRVEANDNTADFVFSDSYELRDLEQVEAFIKENKHLPDIPSAEEMKTSGVNLAEMNKLLLQKIEELTLYLIEKEKKVEVLENERLVQEKRLEKLELLMESVFAKSSN
jgi:hypothetical protein